ALTTSPRPAIKTNIAMMNSDAFPNVTFNNPPMAWPADREICSVACRIPSASGIIASVAVAKTQTGPAWKRCASASDIGTKSRREFLAFMRFPSEKVGPWNQAMRFVCCAPWQEEAGLVDRGQERDFCNRPIHRGYSREKGCKRLRETHSRRVRNRLKSACHAP